MDSKTFGEEMIKLAREAEEQRQRENYEAWKNGVTSKLNKLLDNSEELLNQVRNLGVAFNEKIDATFLKFYVAQIQSYVSDLDDIIAGLPGGQVVSDAAKVRLVGVIDLMRRHLRQALAYNFAAVPTTASAYAILVPVMKMAGFSAEEIASTSKNMCNSVFTPALDPRRDGSFGWALSAAKDKIAPAEAALTAGLRPATVGLWGTNEKREEFGTTIEMQAATTTFSGDPTSPESISASPLELVIVEDSSLFPHTNWQNVYPAPLPNLPWQNQYNGAKFAAEAWVKSLRSISTDLLSNRKRVADLEVIIDAISKAGGC